MSTRENVAHLKLQIDAGADADAEELDRLTRELRDEIQELDVETLTNALAPKSTQ